MRTLVVSCHPCEESFTNHVTMGAIELLGRNHEVRHVDVYQDTGAEHVQWAEAIVWIYPTWWSGPPARLLDWINVNFTKPLDNVRTMAAVSTHGSSWRVNKLAGQLGRRLMTKALPRSAGPGCRTTWIALYNIDRSTAADRENFTRRVERRLVRF